MRFNSLIPELYVADYARSLRFYTEILGFTLEYDRRDPRFGFLSYHGSQLMLQQQEPTDNHTGPLEHPYGRGINVQIHTPDVAALVAALQRHGYPLRRGAMEHWRAIGNNTLSGSKEIHVLDPDGYFLRFSEELGERASAS